MRHTCSLFLTSGMAFSAPRFSAAWVVVLSMNGVLNSDTLVSGWPIAQPGIYNDSSLCTFQLADAEGKAWVFDFSHYANPIDYRFVDNEGHTFYFAVCGNTNNVCNPESYVVSTPVAPVLQTWGSPPPCNPEQPGCTNPWTGGPACCTASCEPLGAGPPQWSLLASDNAKTGGIRSDWFPMASDATDPFMCPINPATGQAFGRNVSFVINCDTALPPGQLSIIGVTQDSANPCSYAVQLSALAACGSAAKTPVAGLPDAAGPPAFPPLPPCTDEPSCGAPVSPATESYLCTPKFTDDSGQKWTFDLTQLPSTVTFAIEARNASYSFSPCGVLGSYDASQRSGKAPGQPYCAPSGFPATLAFGSAILQWGSLPPPGSMCVSESLGGIQVLCTSDCEVLAAGPPAWSLVQADADAAHAAAASNSTAAVAGLVGSWGPVYRASFDPNVCPADPITRSPLPQSFSLVLSCDASIAVTDIVVDGVNEVRPCSYVAAARSGAACGTMVAAEI